MMNFPTIALKKYGLVIYTNFGVRLGGVSYGPLVLIRPKYIQDRGLLEHELVHTRQFWNPRKWFMSKLDREVEAYREQLKWYAYDASWGLAEILATKYGFDLTQEQAHQLITQ